MTSTLHNARLLITGGTGSFGKKFVETVLRRFPGIQRLVIFSRDELKQFEMAQQFPPEKFPSIRFFIGDVRDRDRIKRALEGVDTVIHAAAMKQVPTAEYNPFECIKTNVIGAQNLIESVLDSSVSRVVALSTDKAAAPINLYGATKLCSDKLFVAANNLRGHRDLRLSVVRYGNVMGSRGSVIPFFLDRRHTGTLPITDPEMTRFNITLDEAVELVFHALEQSLGGEIFVPKIPSYRITDLAQAIGPDCLTPVVGIRAGEKLHEEMITPSDSPSTIEAKSHYIIVPMLSDRRRDDVLAEYAAHHGATPTPQDFHYSSGENSQWLNVAQIRDLIREQVDADFAVPGMPYSNNGNGNGKPHSIIPYGRQSISEDDIQAVVDVLRSDNLTQGPMVPQFEKAVADYCGAMHAVAVNSATSALHIACLALGVGPGDRVWTSPNTFVASANCARYCGASVDFVDIDPVSYNMCPRQLAEKLELADRQGTLPKVVIPVHFAGQPCDMAAIHALAERYGFSIIEDASHAIGAKYLNTVIGDCAYSDITVFSFHPVKIITTGEGGVATSRSGELARRMQLLRCHGITREPGELEHPNEGPWYYEQQMLGYNYRMTDLQAALGVSQLKNLEPWIARRHELADTYDAELGELPLILPSRRSGSRSALHLYVVQLDSDATTTDRQAVFQQLREAGIGVTVHYIPVHTQPDFKQSGFCKGMFPIAEEYYSRCLSLPMYSGMTVEQQQRVIAVVQRTVGVGSNTPARLSIARR